MSEPRVTVAVPTLTAGEALSECLESLACQTFRAFEVIVIDNSARGLVREQGPANVRILEMTHNTGFGAAINAAFAASKTPYLATLNDDAAAEPGWLAALVAALDARPDAGLCASQVRLAGENLLDSAGMLLCADGSSKQRGHMRTPDHFNSPGEVLLPSASATLYRRQMLEQTGAFDADFFLYCEDTDLGLRALRAGWRCLFAPDARVEHRYSHSAGRVSPLKAYYVERNRLFVAIKNLPLDMLLLAPWVALARYFWHAFYLLKGQGAAARYQDESHAGMLIWFIVKAHWAALISLPSLLGKRRRIQQGANISSRDYRRALTRFSISAREIAKL